MQLYSVDQQRSQALEAHAAAFGMLKARDPQSKAARPAPGLQPAPLTPPRSSAQSARRRGRCGRL